MQPALILIARKIIGDEEDAKDVVQDSLLRLWQLKEEVQNVRGFARILVRNRSLDLVRKRKTSVQVGLTETTSIAPTDEHDERIERMMTLVESLPTMQQTVLRLRHMEGMETLDPTVKAKMMKHFSDMQKQCTLDSVTAAQVPALQKENNQLQQQVLALKDSISTLKQQQTLVGAISTMPGCIVLVVLIAAITAIALRKGVSFSKGDTKVSIGGEEKK